MRFMHIFGALLMTATAQTQPTHDWKLVIHGGAGVIEKAKITPGERRQSAPRLTMRWQAVRRFSLEAEPRSMRSRPRSANLEDDPTFNAGRGAVLTFDGHIELDAAIMDGRTREAGAVAGVSTTQRPISLARKVMEQSQHVLLSLRRRRWVRARAWPGTGDNAWFATTERRRQLDELLDRTAAPARRRGQIWDRSAPSRSMAAAMSPRQPRPAD